ncbi:MAG: hypothetical protein ONB44_11330 [candidate division KSB1 bacterium]|nr:hypothetical protein [candidate division KSB1 bacterium]MDZ7302715.1 hypothetical protein [candidate division KSB1 bacterium]MDZ7311754.1 hypothetical protein [candidate division KSB1 bacterium]
MNNNKINFLGLAAKTAVVHTITYFFMGILAATFLNYAERFARPEMTCWMRQLNDPLIMAGPLFQPIRGLIFALAFYPLREIFFGKKNGWLVMWWTLVALGILSTFGPPPGSIEGMIYTRIPLPDQLVGWLEVVPQALLLSAILFYWMNHPEKKWLNWVMGVVFFVMLLMLVAGLLTR